MREITILVRFLVVFVISDKCASTEEFIAFSLTETVLFLLFNFESQIQHTGKIFFGKREEMRLTSTLQSFALLQLLAC